MKVIHRNNNNMKVYQCDTCNKLFKWDKRSKWYGSYTDLETNPSEIKYYCSAKCCKKD